MGLTIQTKGVNEYINSRVNEWLEALEQELEVIAETMRINAINEGNYKDQTGALRASIGYAIAVNGKLLYVSGFGYVGSPIKSDAQSRERGAEEGKAYAISLAQENKEGISVILVAGRNYAKWVSTRYNVLSSAKLIGEKLINELKNKELI